jgi:2-polyprenyl-3-methyl-5-hydroxy-6-metoxy-1,4-benzoquinol methylase
MSLTNQEFWDNYWENIKLPAVIDLGFYFERCLDKVFSGILKFDNNKALLEIGCAPGRWLAYFHKKYGYQVSGIDNSAIGCQKTMDNLEKQQVKGKIHLADFIEDEPLGKYDVVLSLGVIEHFENPGLALKRHLDFLKPNGRLIIGIPNFKGANYLIQKSLDKTLLDKHNLKTMNYYFYYNIARDFGLKCSHLKYITGFCPSLFFYPDKYRPGKVGFALRFILKITKWMRETAWFDNVNSPFFSGYLLGVFIKPDIK